VQGAFSMTATPNIKRKSEASGTQEQLSAEIFQFNDYLDILPGVSSYLFNFDQYKTATKEIFLEKQVANWDGYEAKPITEESLKTVSEIGQNLPHGIEFPSIVPTVDGGFSLEWKSSERYLVIEILDREVSCVFLDKAAQRKKSFFAHDFCLNSDGAEIMSWIKKAFSVNA
jgi:hypothetical protein